MEDKDLAILHIQCHGCWWSGDTINKAISSHGMYLALPEYSGISITRVKAPCWISSFINLLRPSDAIWCHRSGSTVAQVMAYCLIVPSCYLNQCWPIISEVQWQSPEGNFTRHTSAIIHLNLSENYLKFHSDSLPGANELSNGICNFFILYM